MIFDISFMTLKRQIQSASKFYKSRTHRMGVPLVLEAEADPRITPWKHIIELTALSNVEDWYHASELNAANPLPDWASNSLLIRNIICNSLSVGSLQVPAEKPASEYAWHPVAGDAKTNEVVDELLANVSPQACAQFE